MKDPITEPVDAAGLEEAEPSTAAAADAIDA